MFSSNTCWIVYLVIIIAFFFLFKLMIFPFFIFSFARQLPICVEGAFIILAGGGSDLLY